MQQICKYKLTVAVVVLVAAVHARGNEFVRHLLLAVLLLLLHAALRERVVGVPLGMAVVAAGPGAVVRITSERGRGPHVCRRLEGRSAAVQRVPFLTW